MSQIRTDQAQLIITVDARESAEYQKTLAATAKGVADMKKLTVGTEEYNKALQEQADISRRLQSSTDYNRLSIKQLSDRRAQLVQLQRTLPGVTFAEAGLERELQQVNTALAESVRRTRAVGQEMNRTRGFSLDWKSALAAGTAIVSTAAIAIGVVAAKYEKYSAMLKVALGSQKLSDDAMKLTKETAAETTFTVDELTESYVKFANRGIRLTKAEMLSLADLAASQGKSFDQLTEAILDAQTGEFERLKEFGIRGSKSGDQATLSFKGFNSTVALTPAAMKEAIVAMGNMEGVTGANAEQMLKLEGRYSNFKDTTEGLVAALGQRFSGFFGRVLGQFTEYGKALTEIISPTKTATQETRDLQSEFNNEIGVLKRLAPEAEGRKEIIDQINIKYKDYLPNLISESDNIDAITKAQKLANDAFEQKILLLVLEENLEKTREKRRKAERALQGAAVSRARTAQENENLGNIGATPAQLEAQKNISKSFIDNTVEGAQRLIKEATDDEKDYIKAAESRAEELGASLQKIRERFADKGDSGSASGGSGGESESAKKEREKAEKEAAALLKKKQELQQKERDALLAFNPFAPTIAQGALDLRLKQLEDASEREQLILQESFLQGKMSLEKYDVESLKITSANLNKQIELLDSFGQKDTDQRRKINVEKLKIDKELVDANIELIINQKSTELEILEDLYFLNLVDKKTYNRKSIELTLQHKEKILETLRLQGHEESEAYKKTQEEIIALRGEFNQKIDADEFNRNINNLESYQSALDAYYQAEVDFNEGRISSAQLTAARLKAIQLGTQEAFSQSVDFTIALLSKDEAARRRNAAAIKAFETAKVVVNAQREISEIWKNANSNPTNILIPGWANIFAGIQTALVVGRSAIAIRNINSQKFKLGGSLRDGGTFQGPSHDNGGVPFRVGGQIHEAEGGEVIINKRSSAIFKDALNAINTYGGYGRPIYMTGGTVPSTQPIGLGGVAISSPPVQSDPRVEMLARSVSDLTQVIPDALANINATINYNHLVAELAKIADIKRQAGY